MAKHDLTDHLECAFGNPLISDEVAIEWAELMPDEFEEHMPKHYDDDGIVNHLLLLLVSDPSRMNADMEPVN